MEDEMSDLGPTERRLLSALRAADEPTDADRARVLAKIGVASGTVSIAAKSSAAPAVLSWKTGAAIVAVIGSVGGAAWIATGRAHSPPVAVAPQSADRGAPKLTNAAPVSEPVEKAERAPLDAPRAQGEARPSKAPSVTRQGSADLDSELALLEQAQQALKQGDSARALAQLERHAAEHPTGVLATERAAIHAVALCESGKLGDGQLEARRFLDRNPRSPLGARVRAACFATKK
jgi:type IV secretory pathway VirB10-like protein